MPVTFGGMASGLDTNEIIKKLVEVEARPIQQWEEEKSVFNSRKDALQGLRSHLDKISQSARELYGHRSSYADKKAQTSDSAAVEASANRFAQSGLRTIEVLQLASTHKISTDPLKESQALPAGKITLDVNGASRVVRFKGGTIKSLAEQFNTDAADIVATSYMNTAGDQYILTIESKTSGKKGEIKVSGDRELIFAAGLSKGMKGQEKERVGLVFDGKYFVPYPGRDQAADSGSLEVDKTGTRVKMTGSLWREYVLPLEVEVKKNSAIEFSVEYAAPGSEEEKALPFRIEMGPEEKTVIKGIELDGYNVSRVRPLEKKEPGKEVPDVMGVGIVSETKDGRQEKLYPIDRKFKGKMEIPIGRDFENRKVGKVVFYCNEGEARFSGASIYTPVEATGLYEPKNEVAGAGDARLKVDGVEVQRDKNEGIDDVIKGLTLNLRRVTERPLTVKIEADTVKSMEKVRAFVEAYNKYLDYSRELTKVEMAEKPGEFKKSRNKTGLFAGDMMVIRLENSLKQSVSNAYPNRAEKPIRIITDLGISTGAINAAWESIRQGKLVVDDAVLEGAIRDNPEGVEQFFGSDNDGDKRTDNGMAFYIESMLKPYLGTGKNIIASKIDFEDSSVKMADQRIERHQEHLKKYEEKLRKKFSTMEQSISGAKSQQEWMKQQMKGMEGGGEK